MTISATRRFIDLIGEVRLERGSRMTERGCGPDYEGRYAFLDGKEAVILSLLYPRHVFVSPHLPGSDLDRAYRSGSAIERADLTDVMLRCRT